MNNGKSGSSVIAGVVGGALVAAVFAILLVAGVLDSGNERTVVRQVVGGSSASGDSDLPTIHDLYVKSAPGVVNIRARVTQQTNSVFGEQSQQGVATGSGLVLDKEGNVLTNAHVVEGATQVTVSFEDETSHPAKVVGRDLSSDLAVLKVEGVKASDLHPLPLGDSSTVEVGAPVIAIGNPFGLDRTITSGIVSALQREIEAPNQFSISNVIQTDAAVNPGNSGGPLLDSRGRVIGINSQIATSGGQAGNVGIAFAVPVNTAKRIIGPLKEKGRVDRAYLGVTTVTVTPTVAERLNLGKSFQGALVQAVVPGGPAAKGGLKAGSDQAVIDGDQIAIGGDIILSVDGKAIKSNTEVAAAIEDKKIGETVQIVVRRGSERETLRIKLGRRPNRVPQ